jgi:alkanesulfonate monooxygenase SsuD/methylene tetrahydromethanopterin reductase-like flavin-dependent oxidoreductase (luciferase family)
MADILSDGRVIFGVARGYHTREVETFGSPLLDQAANRDLFEEGVEIIFKAFNGERFSHKGKYYTIPPEVPYRGYTLKEITLVPRPLHLPLECWQPIQSGSERAFDFARLCRGQVEPARRHAGAQPAPFLEKFVREREPAGHAGEDCERGLRPSAAPG